MIKMRWVLCTLLGLSLSGLVNSPVQGELRTAFPMPIQESFQQDPLGQRLQFAFQQARVPYDAYARGNAPLTDWISARYTTPQLEQLLLFGTTEVRRAAAYGLLLIGQPESQQTLASAIHDPDEQVRRWVELAQIQVWIRAGSPAEQARLKIVTELVARGELQSALRQASLLIEIAPDYAEARNQRAIIYHQMQRYHDAIDDCRAVLARNRHHFGASVGLARCLLQTNQYLEAHDVLQMTAQMHPRLAGLSDQILFVQNEIQKRNLSTVTATVPKR